MATSLNDRMAIFQSKEDDKEDQKVPKGFEKFLKKTRDGPKSTKKNEKKESASKTDDKEKTKDEEDDDLTELEEVEDKKSSKDKESKENDTKKKINDFFFQPNGKGPKWENVGLIAFLTGAFGYYLSTMGSPSEEITYMDFINQYLVQNQC